MGLPELNQYLAEDKVANSGTKDSASGEAQTSILESVSDKKICKVFIKLI